MAGDVKVSVQSAALSTSGTGTTDFTETDFGTPKAWIILLNFDEVDDVNPAFQERMSIGFGDGSSNFCISHQTENNVAKVDCDALKSNTKSFIILDEGANVIIDGTGATITDGVRLTNTTNDGGDAPFCTVIMFGGADLAVSLQRSSINSSQDGTATITHSGFTDGSDKLIFFIGADVSAEDSSSSGINNSFGVCHASGSDSGGWTLTQSCMGWSRDHNAANGNPHATLNSDQVLSIITEAGTQDWSLEVTGYSNSGGTWTVTTRDNGAGAGMEVYSLALDLDDRKAKVGTVIGPTSGTSWTPSVSLGFTPQYVGIGLSENVSLNVIQSSGASGISSNTGSGEETCHTWYQAVNAATIKSRNLFRSRVVYYYSNAVTLLSLDMSHSSFNDGGWTYTINEENAGTARFSYWTIEEVAAAPPSGLPVGTLALLGVGI